MGNLHDGHIQLMADGATEIDCVVASVFVNRLQFCRTKTLIVIRERLRATAES